MIAVALVVMVVFLFLRNWRATLIPSVAVPISIIGTFAAMYLLGFSLDNLSLMALTIATGFVVDDAIVVLENISRHIENGVPRMKAAILGAKEVGFTVLSISVSLVAVFLPILLMGGIVGRLFREFALTLSLAIAVSLVVSLTVTPMMCARLLQRAAREDRSRGASRAWLERQFDRMQRGYARTLGWALAHPRLIVVVLLATIGLNVYLYIIVPKGFFPQQDTGRIVGGIQADQSTSFQAMKGKFSEMMRIVQADPAVDSVAGFTGGRQTNSGFMFISLKPKSVRKVSADTVIQRLREPLADVAGARTFLQAVQDIRVGGRQSNAQYQFTMLSDSTADLYKWGPKLTEALQTPPRTRRRQLRPAARRPGSDGHVRPRDRRALQHQAGADRQHALRRVRPAPGIDDLQRAVAVSRRDGGRAEVLAGPGDAQADLRQHVGRNARAARHRRIRPPRRTRPPRPPSAAGAATDTATQLSLDSVRNSATNSIAASGKSGSSSGAAVSTSKETMIPLSAIAKFGPGNTPLSVNHQSQFVASTISFNLAARQVAVRRDRRDLRDDGDHRRARHDPRQFPGHGAGVPAVDERPAAPDSRGAGGGVHRARHSVRELHPSDHDSFDAAVGRASARCSRCCCSRPSSASSR